MNVAFLLYTDNGVTTQCIKFVLLQLKVTVQIKGLSRWQQSRALPTASAGTPVYWALGSQGPQSKAFRAEKM